MTPAAPDSMQIQVEVVLALPDAAHRKVLSLPPGSTVAQAIQASQLHLHPLAPTQLRDHVGVWNQACSIDQTLSDGDRVEIYRALSVDPMVARRRRAARKARDQAGRS